MIELIFVQLTIASLVVFTPVAIVEAYCSYPPVRPPLFPWQEKMLKAIQPQKETVFIDNADIRRFLKKPPQLRIVSKENKTC